MTVGALASPYVSPYLYESKRRGLDTEYGIRRNGDGFMIGDSRVGVDHDANIHIKNVEFPATQGLWELLTRKRVGKKLVTNADLKQYKTVLKMANVHLEGYDPNANIRTSKSLKFKDVISRLFPGTRQSGVETALRREWVTYEFCHVAETILVLLHRQDFPAYASFNRQLATLLLPVNR